MRYGCALVLTLISSAVPASAQDLPTVKTLGQTLGISMLPPETVVSPDQVVARLMMFDRNGDGKVATAELSERMQVIVARGDIGGDGALDDLEIRAMTLKPLEFVATATKNRQFGGYSFGDTVGLSTRTHILNTITDLRLASAANDEARRIASAFADELEAAARAKLQTAIAPLLTEQQLAEFDRNLNSNNGTVTPMFVARILLGQSQLTPQLVKTATAAVETFKDGSAARRRTPVGARDSVARRPQ